MPINEGLEAKRTALDALASPEKSVRHNPRHTLKKKASTDSSKLLTELVDLTRIELVTS